MRTLIEKLEAGAALRCDEFETLLRQWQSVDANELCARARAVRERHYGNAVYLRGLIEISNHCKNDCYYCGIRRSNRLVKRYRLEPERILDCCRKGYGLGLRTFVLQGGEDPYFTDSRICAVVADIKRGWPDCAVTLSLGEKPRESYAAYREAGADRYLLRHETADPGHYACLHPGEMSFENRMRCLRDLKELGYQVGAGFMVGSPGQDFQTLARDLSFLQEFRPHMVGIGPFLSHRDTPFAEAAQGGAELTLFLLSLIRLMLPASLLPATTALGTVAGDGWERGVLAGANVIMPNLTPREERRHYLLYDNKNITSAEEGETIAGRMASIGHRVGTGRGDSAPF